MPKHRAGAGIAGKHTTIIDAAEPVIDALRDIPEVRVTLGKISKVKSNGRRSIKFDDTESGFQMTIVGNCYKQVCFAIVSEADKRRSRVIKAAHTAFENS